MHFNLLLGIEPKLLLMFYAAIKITEMEHLDFAARVIPAFLVSAFTVYKWVIVYRKNKRDENNN